MSEVGSQKLCNTDKAGTSINSVHLKSEGCLIEGDSLQCPLAFAFCQVVLLYSVYEDSFICIDESKYFTLKKLKGMTRLYRILSLA